MNNVLIFDKMISILTEKRNIEVNSNGNKSFSKQILLEDLYLFKSKTINEVKLLDNMFEEIFGMYYKQFKSDLVKEQHEIRNKIVEKTHLENNYLSAKEIKEIDEMIANIAAEKKAKKLKNKSDISLIKTRISKLLRVKEYMIFYNKYKQEEIEELNKKLSTLSSWL